MGLFDFGKAKTSAQNTEIKAKLDTNVEGVLKDLKQSRVDKCQNMGLSLSKIGQDLAYIERKTREYYSTAVQDIKGGQTQGQAYQNLMNSAGTEADRDIIARMFSAKS